MSSIVIRPCPTCIAEVLAAVVAQQTITAVSSRGIAPLAGALMSLQFWLAGLSPADLEA